MTTEIRLRSLTYALRATKRATSSYTFIQTIMKNSSSPGTESAGAKIPSASGTRQTFRRRGYRTTSRLSSEQNQSISVSFAVLGNPSEKDGNPISKVKLTKRQQWTPKAQLYAAWKDQVRAALMDATRGTDLYPMIVRNIGLLKGKPLTTKPDMECTMDIVIGWKSNTGVHADPEGVFGSIADALFAQDKWLYGSFKPSSESGSGRVDVAISLKNLTK